MSLARNDRTADSLGLVLDHSIADQRQIKFPKKLVVYLCIRWKDVRQSFCPLFFACSWFGLEVVPTWDAKPSSLPIDDAGDTATIIDDDVVEAEVSVRKHPSLIVEPKQFLGKCLVGRTQSLIRAGIRKCSDEAGIVFLAREIRTILDLLVSEREMVEE
jgi:hypothetical protein